jgi:hypothetical protein
MFDDAVTATVLEEAAGGCVTALAAASKGAARADLDFTTLSDMAKTQMRMDNSTRTHPPHANSPFQNALAHGRKHLPLPHKGQQDDADTVPRI